MKKTDLISDNDIEVLDIDNQEQKSIPRDSIKSKKAKKKLKKWVLLLICFGIILLISLFVLIYINHKKALEAEAEKQRKNEKIAEIQSHYSDIVKVNDTAKLYIKNENDYEEVGSIYENNLIKLSDIDIDDKTKYFKIDNSDYYIEYQYVDKTSEKIEYSSRYKNYIPFNKNIITKESFTLSDEDTPIIKFNKSMEFPIIINDYDNKYYVEYDNRLLNINKDDVKEIIDKKNTDKKNRSYITTFAYHRIYDTDEKCTNSYICTRKSLFDKEMKYLVDNNYLTLTMQELHMYLKGSLQVGNATVITLDDGYLFKSAEAVLEKYNLNATMFVISGEFKDYTRFDNLKAISVQSHTHLMHKNYVCSGGNQGGAMLCASKEKIINDLKTSVDSLKVSPFALAFPFYDYNDNAINALKEAGFKMSFIGAYNTLGKSYPKKTNLYKIPRMTIWDENLMSFNDFKSYL